MVSSSPFLRIDGVVKRFGARIAVDRVSLDINPGESTPRAADAT